MCPQCGCDVVVDHPTEPVRVCSRCHYFYDGDHPSHKSLEGSGVRFENHRVICCSQQKYEPYLACCGTASKKVGFDKGHPYSGIGRGWDYYSVHLCGNLMHPSCIDKYGPCHEGAGSVEFPGFHEKS